MRNLLFLLILCTTICGSNSAASLAQHHSTLSPILTSSSLLATQGPDNSFEIADAPSTEIFRSIYEQFKTNPLYRKFIIYCLTELPKLLIFIALIALIKFMFVAAAVTTEKSSPWFKLLIAVFLIVFAIAVISRFLSQTLEFIKWVIKADGWAPSTPTGYIEVCVLGLCLGFVAILFAKILTIVDFKITKACGNFVKIIAWLTAIWTIVQPIANPTVAQKEASQQIFPNLYNSVSQTVSSRFVDVTQTLQNEITNYVKETVFGAAPNNEEPNNKTTTLEFKQINSPEKEIIIAFFHTLSVHSPNPIPPEKALIGLDIRMGEFPNLRPYREEIYKRDLRKILGFNLNNSGAWFWDQKNLEVNRQATALSRSISSSSTFLLFLFPEKLKGQYLPTEETLSKWISDQRTFEAEQTRRINILQPDFKQGFSKLTAQHPSDSEKNIYFRMRIYMKNNPPAEYKNISDVEMQVFIDEVIQHTPELKARFGNYAASLDDLNSHVYTQYLHELDTNEDLINALNNM